MGLSRRNPPSWLSIPSGQTHLNKSPRWKPLRSVWRANSPSQVKDGMAQPGRIDAIIAVRALRDVETRAVFAAVRKSLCRLVRRMSSRSPARLRRYSSHVFPRSRLPPQSLPRYLNPKCVLGGVAYDGTQPRANSIFGQIRIAGENKETYKRR